MESKNNNNSLTSKILNKNISESLTKFEKKNLELFIERNNETLKKKLKKLGEKLNQNNLNSNEINIPFIQLSLRK